MSMTPEYAAALDALGRAADVMARACNEYEAALARARPGERDAPALEALRRACDEARAAHDEALADAWELMEEQA